MSDRSKIPVYLNGAYHSSFKAALKSVGYFHTESGRDKEIRRLIRAQLRAGSCVLIITDGPQFQVSPANDVEIWGIG